MSQETILGGVRLSIQRVKNDEVGLWWAVFVEGTIITNIDTKQLNIEEVAEVIEEAH